MTDILTEEDIKELGRKCLWTTEERDMMITTYYVQQAENQTLRKQLADRSYPLDFESLTEELTKEELLVGMSLGRQRIEALQAQNKRLVEALEKIYRYLVFSSWDNINAAQQVCKQALSTLSAEALEAERRREEVIRAAKAWKSVSGGFEVGDSVACTQEDAALFDAVEALEALEGGK